MGQTRGQWFLRRICLCKGLRGAATMCTDHPSPVCWRRAFVLSYMKSVLIYFTYHTSHHVTPYTSVLFPVFTEVCRKLQFSDISITSKKNPHSPHFHLPQGPGYWNLLSVSLDLPLWAFPAMASHHLGSFGDWFLSHSIMFPRFTHRAAWMRTSFLLRAQ